MNATDQLDEFLEPKIQAAWKAMVIANLRMLEPGCDYFSLAGERDFWRMQMETLIAKRSPEQLARMEAKQCLTTVVAYTESLARTNRQAL